MPLVFSSVETIRVDEGQSTSAIPEIVTLTGGGFAVAWRASVGGVITQAFEADGDKIGTNQEINPAGSLTEFELGALAGGGFAVVYNGGNQVRGDIFSALGADVGDFAADAAYADMREVSYLDLAALPDGNFVVTWSATSDYDMYGEWDNAVAAQTFTEAGLAAQPHDKLSQHHNWEGWGSGSVDISFARIAASGDGFKLALYSLLNTGGLGDPDFEPHLHQGLTLREYDAQLSVIDDLPALDSSIDEGTPLAETASGGTVLAHGSGLSLYDANGDVIVDHAPAPGVRQVVALPDGSFILYGQQQTSSGLPTNIIQARLFTAAGVADGPLVALANDAWFSNTSGTPPESTAMTVLDSGDLALTYRNSAGEITVKVFDLPGVNPNPIVATPGNDTLVGTLDADTIQGLGGDDILIGGYSGDTLDGGDGFDRASYATAGGNVVADLATGGTGGDAAGDTYANIENLEGGEGFDTLRGDNSRNSLLGGGGNDILVGRGGNDALFGQAGADRMDGGLGDDAYYVDHAGDRAVEAAGEGTDAVRTSVGWALERRSAVEYIIATSDTGLILVGNELANRIYGAAGKDTLDDGGGAGDLLVGGLGDDTYRVGASATRVVDVVGQGDDRLFASTDYVLSDEGAIETMIAVGPVGRALTGNSLANRILGADGNDTLSGRGGDDRIDGGAGNDRLLGGTGGDLLEGGLGHDRLEGGTSGDTLTGGVGEDWLYGEADGDVLYGGADDDALFGDAGWDKLNGDAGTDQLFGGDGYDTLIGGAGDDVMRGGAGDDHYLIEDAGDQIFEKAGEGSDTAHVYTDYTLAENVELELLAISAPGGLTVRGNGFANGVTGSDGADEAHGGGGNDVLDGRAGNDGLHGDAGIDRLFGGGGDDQLHGGAGSDSFYFAGEFGIDFIHDFTAGARSEDVIRLDDSQFTDFADVMANATQTGIDVVIVYDTLNKIVLKNVTLASLHADDFGFF